jgi:hypothetical protein
LLPSCAAPCKRPAVPAAIPTRRRLREGEEHLLEARRRCTCDRQPIRREPGTTPPPCAIADAVLPAIRLVVNPTSPRRQRSHIILSARIRAQPRRGRRGNVGEIGGNTPQYKAPLVAWHRPVAETPRCAFGAARRSASSGSLEGSERKSSACEKDCSTVKNKRAWAAERAPRT